VYGVAYRVVATDWGEPEVALAWGLGVVVVEN